MPDDGEGDGDGGVAAARPVGGVPVPVPEAGVAGRGVARCTGRSSVGLASAGAGPGAGVVVRGVARCTGWSVVAPSGAVGPACAGAEVGAGVPVPAEAGVGREAARCTGGSPVAGPDGRTAARRTGVPGVVSAPAAGVVRPPGREVRGAGSGPGLATARCTGGAAGTASGEVVRRSPAGAACGPGAGEVSGPDAGVDGAAARCAGGPDALPLPGAGAALAPAGRAARCTGVPGAVPLSRTGAVPGAPGCAAARWTGAPDDAVPLPGVPDAVAPPDAVGVVEVVRAVRRAPVSGAGVASRRDTARCTGGPAGGVLAAPVGRTARCTAASGAGGAVAVVLSVRWDGEASPAEAEPGSPRSPSADEGAVPEGAGRESVVRRVAGRARRCTAGAPDGALVRAWRGWGAAGGGTGVTRTPRAGWTGVFTGAADDSGPAERDRWTGVAEGVVVGVAEEPPRVRGVEDEPARAPGAVEEPLRAPGAASVGTAGVGTAGAEGSAGSARRGATGIRWTGCAPGGDDSGVVPPGWAGASKAPDSRLSPVAGFSTAGDGARVNDGFCHVGRRPPNPASATPVRAEPVARWIGGRPVQAAATGAGPVVRDVLPPKSEPMSEPTSEPMSEPVSGPGTASAGDVVPSPAMPSPAMPFRRPRSRSRNPTDQPSAMPRVTRDAIWSVYRRRSWCSRSRIASRLQWKW